MSALENQLYAIMATMALSVGSIIAMFIAKGFSELIIYSDCMYHGVRDHSSCGLTNLNKVGIKDKPPPSIFHPYQTFFHHDY